ncbi:gliding motility-associated C-terminal domain-containing protein [Hymenobacter sp. ASUV-10]|uniref:Gliding motility-associated C-terminal domain-containing protein n=1 Tax=Hymenobacter aranciens TaxID=3063996 RepID=A0ABT9BES7_9BACT|nr:gliding motility-associated C-terminal domain-containing protein [Hymenobacter sp. ASUV-10]MDO7876770.1 gliding motility-associated C-terminal domain-containing protein [Hymenobacter sp. ASUV-10]
MKLFFLRWGRAVGQLPLLALTLWVMLGLLPNTAEASHIRAGDIQARVDTTGANPRRIFFKLTLYTDLVGLNGQLVTQDEVTIFFGDGTAQEHIRRTTTNAIPIPSSPDTGLNVYLFEHTFPSAREFKVSFIGENRNQGIRNMTDSNNQTFYISTTVRIDPALGLNQSPVLNAPAFDKAGIRQVFLHNPAGSDADGDSLSYKLINCQQVPLGVAGTLISGGGNNRPVPVSCTNYRYPNDPQISGATNPVQVAYNGIPVGVPGAPAVFVQDAVTGQITWNAPILAGYYNIAFKVEEWRRSATGIRQIGEVVRDMQIIVRNTLNLRPELTVPADVCVVAGDVVRGVVTAVDGTEPGYQGQTAIQLFAYGGMLPPATFTQGSAGPPQARGEFVWRTECNDVARLPHQVVFKAQDTPASPGDPVLVDVRTWNIRVVGPAPQNVQASASVVGGLNSALLTWDRYTCNNARNLYIYRREGAAGTTPGPCETGIPASSGYVRIGTVTAATMSFVDTNLNSANVAQGLVRGKTYCYRIYADFQLPAGGESLASAEACVTFAGRQALLKNVDITQTNATNGRIDVRWTKPDPGNGAPFAAPLGYRILRSQSTSPTVFVPVRTLTTLDDTMLTDTGLNTQDVQYIYKLEFFSTPSGREVVENGPVASSVRTSIIPNGLTSTITVNWRYDVPWDNSLPQQPTTIYRRSPGGAFVQIGTAQGTATGGTYVDRDPSLRKQEEYCYYVQTDGRYPGVNYLTSLLNKSQERCVVLTDVPCDPILTLVPTNCDSLAALQEFPTASMRYSNNLRWTLGNSPAGCKAEASYYRIFYRAGNAGPYTLIDSVSQTSYTHRSLDFSGGCYQVQAVDQYGVRSNLSNEACQDNCVFFVLPNIFTPNGDGKNDTFRPKNSSPLRRVHFTAFNRWGVKVFENTTNAEIFINWDGGGPAGEVGNSSNKVVDGVYFYQAEVEFADNNNTKRTYKGWVEVLR